MTIHFPEVISLLEEFDVVAAKAQNFAIFTRDIALQKRGIVDVDAFIEKARQLKDNNRERFTEPELNLILCIIYLLTAMRSELNFLVYLKEGKMDNAWVSLIHSQTQMGIAASNWPFERTDMDNYISRLIVYEKILFPKMIFHSVGGIIKKTRCSICGVEYEDCDHMKGRMYSGELCIREIHEMDLEEASVVENPANKLCRCLSIQKNGKMVNWLTLLEETTKKTKIKRGR